MGVGVGVGIRVGECTRGGVAVRVRARGVRVGLGGPLHLHGAARDGGRGVITR